MRRGDESFLAESRGAKVQQEPAFQASRLQVVDDLRVLASRQFTEGFQFHEHFFEAEKVGTKLARKLVSLVEDREFDLLAIDDPARPELIGQGLLINGLQEPVTQLPVDLDRRADDGIGLFVILDLIPFHDRRPSASSADRSAPANGSLRRPRPCRAALRPGGVPGGPGGSRWA